jgi:hypothetical protein
VHKTDKTDLDEIESELIEPEKVSMYDSSNNIKIDLTPVLTIKEV